MPTVAFNFRKVRKGNITLKIWDVAGPSMLIISTGMLLAQCSDITGQPKFRSMWERYCNGVDAIMYVVSWDWMYVADNDRIPQLCS